MKILAIIPARGGSKTLPNKNIRDFNGKPLISWSISPSLNSKLIDRTIVSTDSPRIAEVAKRYGDIVPFLRPAHLAEDNSSSVGVVEHAVQFHQEQGQTFDYVLLLQPTSPLRTAAELDQIITHFLEHSDRFDALVAVVKPSMSPQLTKKIVEGRLLPFFSAEKKNARRQDFAKTVAPCGMAYLIKVETFLNEKTLYPKRTLGYLVDDRHRYDIDDIYDFIAAQSIQAHFYDVEHKCYREIL